MRALLNIESSNNNLYLLAHPVYIVYFLLIVFELGLVPDYIRCH